MREKFQFSDTGKQKPIQAEIGLMNSKKIYQIGNGSIKNPSRTENDNQMSRSISILAGCIILFTPTEISFAAPTCDFRGIGIGDKFNPEEIMKKLSVVRYAKNPSRPDYTDLSDEQVKYGMVEAIRIYDWKIGPHCDDSSCTIPYGITIGESIPISLSFYSRNGLISLIGISTKNCYWENLQGIAKNKYGQTWRSEITQNTPIINRSTKKVAIHANIELLTLKNYLPTKNKKIQCEVSIVNYDQVSVHHDPLGPFQATLIMKEISIEF